MNKMIKIALLLALAIGSFACVQESEPEEPTATIVSEGSVASPVTLTLGTPHQGSINGAESGQYISYYKITLTTTTNVKFAISNMSAAQDLMITFHNTNSTYQTYIFQADLYLTSTTGEALSITNIPAGTYYYSILNFDEGAITYTVSATSFTE